MSFASMGPDGLNYFPCRYGRSKLLFRGPRRRLDTSYVAFLGGIETYGKFIEMPFPTLTEHETGLKSVNLGCANLGVDAYLGDESLLQIASQAKVTVIQVMGPHNLSNRFYAVHSRRNDRFLGASSLLKTIYGEVDFTEFSFTRHLLTTLAEVDADKFAIVANELKENWLTRMTNLIELLDSKVILLWLADREVGDSTLESEPLFVDKGMMDRIEPKVNKVVEIVATPDERSQGLDAMRFGSMERMAAEEMLGPLVHQRAALSLAQAIRSITN